MESAKSSLKKKVIGIMFVILIVYTAKIAMDVKSTHLILTNPITEEVVR